MRFAHTQRRLLFSALFLALVSCVASLQADGSSAAVNAAANSGWLSTAALSGGSSSSSGGLPLNMGMVPVATALHAFNASTRTSLGPGPDAVVTFVRRKRVRTPRYAVDAATCSVQIVASPQGSGAQWVVSEAENRGRYCIGSA